MLPQHPTPFVRLRTPLGAPLRRRANAGMPRHCRPVQPSPTLWEPRRTDVKQWPMSADEFAEENAANYIGGRFDPKAAEAARRASQQKLAELQKKGPMDWLTPAQRHKPQGGAIR